jgi:hypothetical protein
MTSDLNNSEKFVPKKVFIVPYRNRIQHKFFFCKHMSFILEDNNDYEIYFSHQCDVRTFNRGAVKNIGFMAIRDKYPEHYKNITFIFNDVDTIPFYKIFDYETNQGIVKHYYGYKYALGGIVVIKGSDFEKINGYPCYWGWGMEDNVLQKRCEWANIKIDRSVFYEIGSPQILQLFDGISRIISKKDPWRMQQDNGVDGIKTINNLIYKIDSKSENPNDNIFIVDNPNIYVINIVTFLTHIKFENDNYYNYDLREPKRKIINPDKIKETRKTISHTEDWSKIPYYPTSKERREEQAKILISQGKPIPLDLLKKIEEDRINELKNDVYNKTSNTNNDNITNNNLYEPQYNTNNVNNINNFNNVNNSNNSNIYYKINKNINPFSPEYANYIGLKPKATASARIKLGGVY